MFRRHASNVSSWVAIALALVLAPWVTAQTFSEQLTGGQTEAFGLEKLTPAERTALFEAIERYKDTGAAAAAEQAAKEAAEAAVAEYREQEEPGVIRRAMDIFKREEATKNQERFTGVLKGKFRGWEGKTVFYLEDGQVWQQTARDTYYPRARENVEVVIYRSKSGYYRMRVLDDEGAWVTVKRIR